MKNETAKAYQKARIKCRLDQNELRMAARLGIPPEKLLSMIPGRNENWKDPVALRIRRLYDRAVREGSIPRTGSAEGGDRHQTVR